jgi:hypothetical protein
LDYEQAHTNIGIKFHSVLDVGRNVSGPFAPERGHEQNFDAGGIQLVNSLSKWLTNAGLCLPMIADS